MQNKKWFKTIISIILTLVMVMTVMPKTQATEQIDFEMEFAAKARATEASERLMAYFAQSGFYCDYPDYYAGCYIGDDYKFHVRLCLPTTEVLEMLTVIFGEYSDVIVYEYSDFSWNDMIEYADNLAKDLIVLGYGITSWGVDDFTGSVSIDVLSEDLSEVRSLVEGQQTYAAGNNCPSIILKEGAYSQSAAGYQPGTSNGNILLGGYGYYNGNKAIVTCGHGGHSVGDTFSFGNVSGEYVVQQYEDEQIGDYAIGLINDNATLLHKFGNSDIAMTGFNYSPVAGSSIRAYRSNGSIVYGTVVDTDKRIQRLTGKSNPLYMYLLGMTEVRITSGSVTYGDSGAPCITYTDGFCGVLSGFSNLGEVTYFQFTPNRLLRSVGFYVFAEPHNTSWQALNADQHYGFCSSCQEIVYERHDAYWDEAAIPHCTRCGYIA